LAPSFVSLVQDSDVVYAHPIITHINTTHITLEGVELWNVDIANVIQKWAGSNK